ncbi:GNAT family N-acetyltransferase [Shewanella sp. C31]|nr:GNAT family N-acetyltransferase [Shewanella electrica]
MVGFIELDDDGHIDCMYTAPNYQRCGIASALYAVLEQHAIALALPRLYVEASYLAQPFFFKQGFRRLDKNVVDRNGTQLLNFTMESGSTLLQVKQILTKSSPFSIACWLALSGEFRHY